VALNWSAEPERHALLGSLEVAASEWQGDPLPVRLDPARGAHVVDLPECTWNVADEPDRLDRYRVTLKNPTDKPALVRLAFDLDAPLPGITGMSPVLRDADGCPTGIPVQISKNWHRKKDRRLLYEGPWFHGYTMLRLPPNTDWTGEFNLAYARWGGVPAASHAQLSLVGWGVNQLWHQAAIGSWGESICYDPDVNLNRSMIDDVRPLMVTSMSPQQAQWNWTCNVGGGDFLVYFDATGDKQYLTRVRSAHPRYGPNLTGAVYAGVTADGCIEARIEAATPRCDDINRAFHHIRYDVRKHTPFSRLAFYQLGADNYNDHAFATMARGDADSALIEEWEPARGGKKYSRTGIECTGPAPWFSLHAGERNAHHKHGAWANRGLIIRSWKARLGGKDVPHPFAAVYGTDNGVPSANVELTPPPGLNALEPGDFVEADLELIILPMAADDYYGPNKLLREHLGQHANTWRPVHREAAGNNLRIDARRGTAIRTYPVEVQVDEKGQADVDVTGGTGYAPLTFSSLNRPDGYALFERQGDKRTPVDQSVHGNDFWQTDYDTANQTWSITYNVLLDPDDGKRHSRRFQFHAGAAPSAAP
ncbi:MAG: hypothetical protein GY851_19925, partial [bacterium]|nr:hypothetical protein [bacterium]